MAKLTLEDFLKIAEEQREEEQEEMERPERVPVVRVLRDCRIALPRDNPISPGKEVLTLKKEDVLSLPEPYIRILRKGGVIEVIEKA